MHQGRFWFVATAAVFVLAGCASAPGDTVAKMHAHMCEAGDPGVIQEYVSEGSKPALSMITMMMAEPTKAAMVKADIKQKCDAGGDEVEILETTIDDDTAVVRYKVGDETETTKLVKEDGEWKLVFEGANK